MQSSHHSTKRCRGKHGQVSPGPSQDSTNLLVFGEAWSVPVCCGSCRPRRFLIKWSLHLPRTWYWITSLSQHRISIKTPEYVWSNQLPYEPQHCLGIHWHKCDDTQQTAFFQHRPFGNWFLVTEFFSASSGAFTVVPHISCFSPCITGNFWMSPSRSLASLQGSFSFFSRLFRPYFLCAWSCTLLRWKCPADSAGRDIFFVRCLFKFSWEWTTDGGNQLERRAQAGCFWGDESGSCKYGRRNWSFC